MKVKLVLQRTKKIIMALQLAEAVLKTMRLSPGFNDFVEQQWFELHSGSDHLLHPDGFTKLFVSLGEDRRDCSQYFAAIQLLGRPGLTYDEFLVAVKLMNWKTPHRDSLMVLRCHYIFRFFDVDGDGFLDFREFQSLIYRIRQIYEMGVSQQEVIDMAMAEAQKFPKAEKLSLSNFLEAATTLRFKKTTKLFRFRSFGISEVESSKPSVPEVLSRKGTKPYFDKHEVVADAPVGGKPTPVQFRSVQSLDKAFNKIDHNILPHRIQFEDDRSLPVHHIADNIIQKLLLNHTQQQLTENHNAAFTLCSFDDLLKLCSCTIESLKMESAMEEINGPVKIFGDIHGQLGDLLAFFDQYGAPHVSNDIEEVRYMFLGDFVDRGSRSLEVIALLAALKVTYPSRVILVRGNHETRQINRAYGFYEECCKRLPISKAQGEELWEGINKVFDWLPLAALVNDSIFCVHGGIGKVQTLDQVKKIPRPLVDWASNEVAVELLWSDPTINDTVMGLHHNTSRGMGSLFGPDVVQRFCERNGVGLIVRAHQVVESGHEYFANLNLITVFSATNYCGKYENAGGMVKISSESLVRIFRINPRHEAWPQQYSPASPPRAASPPVSL